MAVKKQFWNTKSIVKVETGIVTLISYHHYLNKSVMTAYAKRKLKYSRNENFNLLHYVEWDRILWNAVAVLCWMFVICKAVTCVVMFYYCNVKSQVHGVMLTFHNVKSCHHDVMLTFYNVVSQCHDVMHINLCVK